MPALRTGLDEETYKALLADAERHMRPPERHMAVLIRLGLGLPVPLPSSEPLLPAGESVNVSA